MKKMITENDVILAWKARKVKIFVTEDGIITPAALDAARVRNIEIIRGEDCRSAAGSGVERFSDNKSEKIVIGSDHGGFELKKNLRAMLEERGYEVEDVGTFSTDSVDYPDLAHLVAQKVACDLTLVGIIIDGAGVGSAMAANKVPGIRAAACYDTCTARNSREHNFANVLTLGSRVIGIDIAEQIVVTWLNTGYGAERHKRRVDKIMQIETTYLRS